MESWIKLRSSFFKADKKRRNNRGSFHQLRSSFFSANQERWNAREHFKKLSREASSEADKKTHNSSSSFQEAAKKRWNNRRSFKNTSIKLSRKLSKDAEFFEQLSTHVREPDGIKLKRWGILRERLKNMKKKNGMFGTHI